MHFNTKKIIFKGYVNTIAFIIRKTEKTLSENYQYVVETNNLVKGFGKVKAVDGIDLKVAENSIYGFIGPNGGGKTTTIKLLLGLLFPDSGNGKIFGRDIVDDSLYIRSMAGYLPQKPLITPI